MSDTPTEVGSVTGTIEVAGQKADVRECVLRRTTSSKDGRKYGVDLVAPAGQYEILDSYERSHIVHGRVRLDCTAEGTHVVVAASVDNCE